MNRTRRMAVSTAVAGAVVVGAGAAVGAAFASTTHASAPPSGHVKGTDDAAVLAAQLKALDGQANGLKGSMALTKAQIEAALLAQQRAAAQAFTNVVATSASGTATTKHTTVRKTESPRPTATPTPSHTHTTTGASSSSGDDNGNDDNGNDDNGNDDNGGGSSHD